MNTRNPGDGRDRDDAQSERPAEDRPTPATTPESADQTEPSTPPSGGTDWSTPVSAPSGPAQPPEVDWSTPTSVPPGTGQEPAEGAPEQQPGVPRRGSVQRQEAGITQPRPPTVAEARARDKARRRAEEAQRAAAATEEAKKRKRKRVMIGGVAIVGVAGLVGGGYLAYRALAAPDRVTAYCVKAENGQEVVVDDSHCGEGRPGFSSGPGVIILGGGPQYRYHYGGTGTIGKPPTGGTTIKPKGAEIKTKSGATIQRGGLGSKSTGGGS
ncbi:hypothetical protein [Nocardia amamiensis]|uniref:hypothetical protein n=1 Tax=Nocardia amamiensis TaxID=404578 RepID=UPI000AA20059|nr:hypothetical protein [Nocardia amamiensis]